MAAAPSEADPGTQPLTSLIARVEAATGPDQNLGDDVLFATRHRYSVAFVSGTGWRWKGADLAEREVPITASLDAALALVERVLPPGVWIELSGPRKYLNIPTPVPNYWRADCGCIGWGATPPLAMLAALLRALQAQSPRHNARDGSPAAA